MPVTSSQLFEITLFGSGIDVEPTVNVFHYRGNAAGTAETAQNVLSAFETVVLPSIANIIHDSWSVDLIRCIELNGTDFHEVTSVVQGQRPGEAAPTFVTASFLLVRSDRDVRNGQKRFSPISEDDMQGNNFVALFEGLAATTATALAADLIDPATGGGKIVPCVLHRQPIYTPSYTSTNVASAKLSGVGSQVSRKAKFS